MKESWLLSHWFQQFMQLQASLKFTGVVGAFTPVTPENFKRGGGVT